MGHQELFLSASVLGAAIAPDNCLHDANMRLDRLKFHCPSHERSAASPGLWGGRARIRDLSHRHDKLGGKLSGVSGPRHR